MNLQEWKANKKFQSRINYGTQTGRVIRVMTEFGGWYTLREIEKMIAARYQDKDTQAAISARLREITPFKHGLIKHRKMEMVNGKQVHRYSLIPFMPVREVAEKVGVIV